MTDDDRVKEVFVKLSNFRKKKPILMNYRIIVYEEKLRSGDLSVFAGILTDLYDPGRTEDEPSNFIIAESRIFSQALNLLVSGLLSISDGSEEQIRNRIFLCLEKRME